MSAHEETDGARGEREQLCQRISADCADGLWRGNEIEVPYKRWRIRLDVNVVTTPECSVPLTRMRALYTSRDRFHFKIYRRGFFDRLRRALGLKVIEVGDAEFDREFAVEGSSAEQLRALFSDEAVCRLLRAQSSLHLESRTAEGWPGSQGVEGTDELCFHAPGFIGDVEQLKLLFSLFAAVLDRLCRIGSACEEAPPHTG